MRRLTRALMGAWGPILERWARLEITARLERKVEDLWVGVFWRVDDTGRVHLWSTLGTLPTVILGAYALTLYGLPWGPIITFLWGLLFIPLGHIGAPLHISWRSSSASSELMRVSVVDQYMHIIHSETMSRGRVAGLQPWASTVEVRGEDYPVRAVHIAPAGEGKMRAASIVVYSADAEAARGPLPTDGDGNGGYTDWDEFLASIPVTAQELNDADDEDGGNFYD